MAYGGIFVFDNFDYAMTSWLSYVFYTSEIWPRELFRN